MPSVAAVWPMFATHMIRYRDPGLTVDGSLGPGWFAVLTGLPDIELNVTGLHEPAGAAEAEALARRIERSTSHALTFVSADADPAAADVLAASGFARTATPEPLMWRPGSTPPPRRDGPFAIRRVADDADLSAIIAVLEAAITMPPDVARRQFALERLVGDGLGAWIAWDGGTPVSAVTLSWDGGSCGVWEMMTSPEHRGRGAGRAVLSAALAEVLRPSMDGSLLVSTPLGRPLYESVGFTAIDESITWTFGATAEDLARIGQTAGSVA